MERTEVYKLIDCERDYQDSLGKARTDGQPRTVGGELILLTEYIDRARKAWTNNPGNEKALEEIRKVAAIAVRRMEHNDTEPRAFNSSLFKTMH